MNEVPTFVDEKACARDPTFVDEKACARDDTHPRHPLLKHLPLADINVRLQLLA